MRETECHHPNIFFDRNHRSTITEVGEFGGVQGMTVSKNNAAAQSHYLCYSDWSEMRKDWSHYH